LTWAWELTFADQALDCRRREGNDSGDGFKFKI